MKHTAEARAKFSAMMKSMRSDPAFNAKAAAAQAAKFEWNAERVEQLRAVMAAGHTVSAASKILNACRRTIGKMIARHEIPAFIQDPEGKQAALEAVLLKHYPSAMPVDEVVRLCSEAAGRPITRSIAYHEARKLGVFRPEVKSAGMPSIIARVARNAERRAADAVRVQAALDTGEGITAVMKRLRIGHVRLKAMRVEGLLKVPPRVVNRSASKASQAAKIATYAARRAAIAVKVQALLDDGASLERVYEELDIGAVFVRRMRREGLVNMPIRQVSPPRVVKQSLTTAPRASRALPTILFGTKDIRRPVIGPVQTVEEFLAAGGKVTTCPAVAVAATTATISDADRAAAAAHTMARGGYGYTDTWRAINKRIQTAAKKAKAEAETRSGPDEQMRIAA